MENIAYTSEGLWMIFFLGLSIVGMILSIKWNMWIHRIRKYYGYEWSNKRLQRNKEKEIWAWVLLLISTVAFLAIINTIIFKI